MNVGKRPGGYVLHPQCRPMLWLLIISSDRRSTVGCLVELLLLFCLLHRLRATTDVYSGNERLLYFFQLFISVKIVSFAFTSSVLHSLVFSVVGFYARQLYRQVLPRARISYGNSVCLSVCLSVTTRYGFKARCDRDSGSSPYDSLEYLVSYEVILCHWMKRFSSNEGIKEGYPLRKRYVTTIGSSSVKTVADRHRLAAYHNKHCR